MGFVNLGKGEVGKSRRKGGGVNLGGGAVNLGVRGSG